MVAIIARGRECRVLVVGAGAGLVPLVALKAGAKHVTCVERWVAQVNWDIECATC